MQIKEHLQTKSKSVGTNTCEFIILHHTGTKENTIKGNLNYLTTSGKASAHYVVDTNGDLYKIWEHTDILWHAGVSTWRKQQNLNRFSIGIEIIWPLSNWGFTDEQRATVASLVNELWKRLGILEHKVLRHADLTNSWSSKGILWDGKSSSRKVDIANTFWNNKYKSFNDYRISLFLKNTPMESQSKYTEIMKNVIKETWFEPLFERHDGDKPLTEQESKELTEIAMARFFQRLQGKK